MVENVGQTQILLSFAWGKNLSIFIVAIYFIEPEQ